ncbi:hypothetical protein HDG34_003103 [Paraburkholderia sp. HC6.4b]|uniref:hypothetical protein n=1 Tax=unclassified Paraburkholderia TaxID=2615204 RepID=UPI001615A4F2|nr:MULTISPECIES: hypothetical protein [unclassified Paraburkholderia]MBB5409162.1 hypothetical protein [Paraburkholderia sp. HC6.4b]MBB5450890.1 hypothetical protein [Paraburkholderia sp. Kb1A]
MTDPTDESPRLRRSNWIEVVRRLRTISLKGLGILLQHAFNGTQEAPDNFINWIRSQILHPRDLDWIDEHAPAFRIDVIDLVHPQTHHLTQTLSITFRSLDLTVHHPLIINVYLDRDRKIQPGSMLVLSKLE